MRALYAGIDSGSWNTKAVVIDDEAAVCGCAVVRSGADLIAAAHHALEQALQAAGAEGGSLSSIWATGFGRHSLEQGIDGVAGSRTELDCHARGARHHMPGKAITVVDIGGQDAKVIRLDERGRRVDHRMNRKCAAGTGSFLEEMALRLDTAIDGLPALAAGYSEELNLGSFCTVFTATELLSAIREGKRPADLARAAYRSVVKRVLGMATIDATAVGTGGVLAHHPMMRELLAEALGGLIVPPRAQHVGALGAALAAREAAVQPQAGGDKEAAS